MGIHFGPLRRFLNFDLGTELWADIGVSGGIPERSKKGRKFTISRLLGQN